MWSQMMVSGFELTLWLCTGGSDMHSMLQLLAGPSGSSLAAAFGALPAPPLPPAADPTQGRLHHSLS